MALNDVSKSKTGYAYTFTVTNTLLHKESLFPLIADALGCSRIRHITRHYRKLVIVLIEVDENLENDIIPRAMEINFNLVVSLTKDLVLLKEVLLSRRALTEHTLTRLC